MKFKIVNDRPVFYIDNGCNVEEWLKKDGLLYGEKDAKLLHTLVTNFHNGGEYILDCGAHIGTFALPMVSLGHKVICVEAAKENVECLKMTFSEMPQVEIHEAILLDGIKDCGFSRENGPFGWVQDGTDRKSTTIDEICKGKRISGIKIDIEGAEFEALEGAYKTLESLPPMIAEVNGFCLMQRNLRCEDLLQKIEAFGYNLYCMIQYQSPQGPLEVVHKINPTRTFPFGMSNIFALKEELSDVKELDDKMIGIIYEACKKSSNNELKQYFEWIES